MAKSVIYSEFSSFFVRVYIVDDFLLYRKQFVIPFFEKSIAVTRINVMNPEHLALNRESPLRYYMAVD